MSATATRNLVVLERWLPFAQTIRQGRLAHGWTLRQFERLSGISFRYLAMVETAKCPPPSDAVLMRMAEHLEIPAERLFALAGRLPPGVEQMLWSNQAAPAFLATLGGLTLPDAQIFCAQVGKLLPIG